MRTIQDQGMQLLVSLGLLVAGGYVLLVLAMFLYQDRLLYQPNVPGRRLVGTPADLGLAYQSVDLETSDGVAVHGWFVPARDARATVLFFHGNAGNISHRLERLALFHRLGLNSFIVDYRGYGQSGGRPSEHGTYRDARAAWEYLTERRSLAPERVLVFGHSLGGAVAAHLASRVQPGALMIEASFLSLPEVAAHHYPWLPVRLLSRFRYDVRHAVARVASPVLISHSREDSVIPYEHGRGLFQVATDPKWFMEILGDHDRGFLVTGEAYFRQLDRFVGEVFPATGQAAASAREG